MTSRDEAIRALEKAVELVAKATKGPWAFMNEKFDDCVLAFGTDSLDYDAPPPWYSCWTSINPDDGRAIIAAVNFIREHGAAILSARQEVAPVADSELVARARQSVSYSHNFATAKPDIGATEREHILGLCKLVEELIPPALMASRETEDDGAAIMGRLARALAKADPSSKLPRMAIEWLRSQGIHWKSHCPTDPLHDFGHQVTDNKSINQLRQIRYRFDYSGTFEDAERCAAIDAAIDALTSPAHTSEARDVLWTGWYHPDPEEQDDFMLYDAKDHRCDDCIRVHVVRADDDAAMRQEAGDE